MSSNQTLDKPFCSRGSVQFQRRMTYILTFLVTVMFTLMVGILNEGAVTFFASFTEGMSSNFYVNLHVPALIEDIFLRPVAAAFVMYVIALQIGRKNLCYNIQAEAFRLGFVGGFAMGVTELYLRIIAPSCQGGMIGLGRGCNVELLIWNHPGFRVALLAPFVMHFIAATINMGTFYRVAGDFEFSLSDLYAILAATILGITIHWVFNTWVQQQFWFWRMWRQELGIPLTLAFMTVLFFIGASLVDNALERRRPTTVPT